MKYLPLIFLLLLATPSEAKTIYVRPDGGTGTQCDGTHDAAQDGATDGDDAGTIPDCAFNSPLWPLPLYGQPQTWKAIGGDTIVIKNNSDDTKAEYRIGCQGTSNCRSATVNITNGTCDSSWTYDCGRIIPPSGTSNNPTKIIGCSVDGCGTGAKPQLWGTGRQDRMFQVSNTHDIIFSDLEITDHASQDLYTCVTGINSLCSRTAFYGAGGWYNLTFKNLWIHGLANRGFLLGGQVGGTDHVLTLENVIIDKNFYAGYDLDTCGGGSTCGYHGTMTFTNVDVTYNGCVEVYPLTGDTTSTEGDLVAGGCKDQNNGGYGDGFGTIPTGGNWTFTGCNFSHNTSDGLDMLSLNWRMDLYGNGSLTFKKSMAEGNVGNGVKGPNNMLIEDSIILANCGYFYGKSFKSSAMEICRQSGGAASPLAIRFWNTTAPQIYNSTIFSNADAMFVYAGTCTGGAEFKLKNNILRGGIDFAADPTYIDNTAFQYNGGSCPVTIVESNNVVYGEFKNLPTLDASDTVLDPKFTGTIKQGPDRDSGYYSGDDYAAQVYIASDSSALNLADMTISGLDKYDYNNFDRTTGGTNWDSGALDYGSTPAAPSCQTDCSLCTSQVNCEGSATTCYWAASGICQTGADPCQSNCQQCVGQTACEASDATCYWWDTTLTCEATAYNPPTTCDTDCTVCANSAACLASAFPCFVQLDGSCASTKDPCNVYCNNCLNQTLCEASTELENAYPGVVGCKWWSTNQCRKVTESCSLYNQDPSICENTIGCYWHYVDGTCQNTMEDKFLFKGATIYGVN